MGDPAEPSRRKPRGPKGRRTIDGCGCLVAPVGFVLFFGGLFAIGESALFQAQAERAAARVVTSVYRPGGLPLSKGTYDVTVEFQTSPGVVERGRLEGVGRSTGPVEVGQTTTILYRPDRPLPIRQDTILGTWGPAAGFTLLGALMLVAVWAEWRRFKQPRK